ELVSFVVLGHGHKAAEQTQHRIFLGMDLSLLLEEQLDAAVNQEGAEDVDNPVKPLDESHAGHDEHGAHDEGSQNSPEQDLVLMDGGHMEEAENQQEHEEVIDAERKLDDVSGDKLERGGATVPEENHHREDDGQGDPHCAPGQGFAKLYGVGAAMEHTQVEHQHGEDEKIEQDPTVAMSAPKQIVWGGHSCPPPLTLS